jgi:hypothetical protein
LYQQGWRLPGFRSLSRLRTHSHSAKHRKFVSLGYNKANATPFGHFLDPYPGLPAAHAGGHFFAGPFGAGRLADPGPDADLTAGHACPFSASLAFYIAFP